MKDYESTARREFTPIANEYDLEFAALDDKEFFLIGQGFALWIFIDLRDGADVWYVNIDNTGNIFTYTLMYLMEERFTSEDSSIYGDPKTLDERVVADIGADAAWIIKRCKDIITGDKTWLQNYQGKGHYNNKVTKFLAPYFRKQGYPVKIRE